MERGGATYSSKGSKFSAIRNLPAADTSTTTAAVPLGSSRHVRIAEAEKDGDVATNTVRRIQDKERADEEDDETDERIRRHQYAQLVARLNAQRGQYYSTSVFVEAMLKEAQHSADGNPATVAAIATWGLKILARESQSAVLAAILSSLLPALYCKYESSQSSTASPAVQLQVREREVIEDNPYFTHAMFVDEAKSGKQSAMELRQALAAAVKANDGRRNVVMRLAAREQRMRLLATFHGWRGHIRQNRLIQLISDNKARRSTAETEQLQKQVVFYQWQLVVERARSAYLTERLHDAAFQLENAKNQFQLQCYRADRLVQAAKDATDELTRVTHINADLTQEVAALKEERIRREKEFNLLLTRSVSRLLRLLGTYAELSGILLQSQKAIATDSHADAVSDDTDYSELLETHDDVEVKPASSPDTPLEQLRQWANGVLAAVQGREVPFRRIRSFGADFADGERYLCLLQHVFPDVVSSVLSVESMGVETRLRRIRDYAVQCKLRYALLPSDFLNMREDLLVCSVSELRQRHLIQVWKRTSRQSAAALGQFRGNALTAAVELCADTSMPNEAEGGTAKEEGNQHEEDEAGGEEDGKKLLDGTIVTAHIADFVQRLQRTGEEMEEAFTAEADTVEKCIAIAEEESRLGSERLHGTPIPLVEEASRRVFWHLAAGALNDLREEPQLRAEATMWDFVMLQSLPTVLRDNVDVVSRLFFFFAGENAKVLSEVAFWRFVEVSGILVSPLDVSKQWIVNQYDRVVSPQLDLALKTAARNQHDMNMQKLREVAYQEMDIRTATPAQFVELLVRIAVAAENREYGLVEGTRRLLQRLQLPNHEKMTAVERDLCAAEAQNVLHYFHEDLFRTFLFYVKQQHLSRNAQERMMAMQDGGRFSAQMSVTMLLTILDDCHYLSDGNERSMAVPLAADATRPQFFVSTAQVRKLVPLLERQYKLPTTGFLSFSLFVDVLATLAYHWCPDPLVPSPRRLAAFLSYTFQRLNAHHINSTLLLGNPPTISLEGSKTVDFSQQTHLLSGNA